jgi:hypothetical protein
LRNAPSLSAASDPPAGVPLSRSGWAGHEISQASAIPLGACARVEREQRAHMVDEIIHVWAFFKKSKGGGETIRWEGCPEGAKFRCFR